MELDFDDIAERLVGFSGSDIKLLCKEAAMRPVRRLMDKLEADVVPDEKVKLDLVTAEDMAAAMEVTRPSAHLHTERYPAWQKEFGSS